MTAEPSILKSVKLSLGLTPDYTPFDQELIMHINSVFGDLNQLGLGPLPGFVIDDDSAEWDNFIQDELRYMGVKTYMNLRVRMIFDPPDHGGVLASFEKQIEKFEWRLNMAREDIDHPATT